MRVEKIRKYAARAAAIVVLLLLSTLAGQNASGIPPIEKYVRLFPPPIGWISPRVLLAPTKQRIAHRAVATSTQAAP